MKSTSIFAALFVFWAVGAAAEPCVVRSSQDILNCVLERHPDLELSRAASERDSLLASVARQRPNPELESKIVAGTGAGADDLETETSLLHTVELGSKRKTRILRAAAAGEVSAAERRKVSENVALTAVLSLNRLRQIRTERSYLRESIATFDRILSQLKTRPLLSPEQSVSRSVFEMARDEYRLKETSLLAEEEGLKADLEFSTGLSFAAIQPYLPAAKSVWPKVSREGETGFDSGDLQKAQAEAKLATAGLKGAKSESWPDLKIGPTVQTADPSGSGRAGTSVGGTISLPLPLLGLNRGGRRFAAAEEARAELNLQVTRERLESERRKQVERYGNAVKILSQVRSRSELATKHKSVDELFERGLAPGALVLESHRQLIDIVRSLHERELAALDALWRLYILDGKLAEAKL